jgi:hypothetical protein
MVLLASAYDQSKFLKAGDLPAEKKFRIKSVTEEEVGIGKDKERKLGCVVHQRQPRPRLEPGQQPHPSGRIW